jgi:hypothetical protein
MNIIAYDFGLIEWTRVLKSGAMLIISGTRTKDGGLLVHEVRYQPKMESITHDQQLLLAA